MIRTPSKLFACVIGLSLLTAACTSNAADEPTSTTTTTATTTTTTTATTTTTTAPPTTTTTIPPVEVSDAINGIPADNDLVDRRVVAIKIDNHPNARPQSGLETADAVYEVLVEGGITRFIALFHQSDGDYVGPNRSGRVTDSKLMASLAGSPLQISGAQGWVKDIFRADDINVVWDNGTTTYRVPHRPRPHNLFTSSLLVRAWADDRGWPDESPGNLFAFGEPTPGETPATTISAEYSDSHTSNWEWDEELEQYVHFQGSQLHEWVTEDGDTGPVTFDTIVVMKMRKYIARNPAGSGTSLPTVDTVGTGEAVVFYGGQAVTGMWARDDITEPFTLTDADGAELVLPPSRIWMSLIPDDESVTWE